ncbi:MAG: s-methyl-5-thioribose-1-phosphate isomerase [Syntrophomonadaceae bacterium]|nr:s-methyl-5-thioribose-1-phosphate isomerase [Syntrophomonadaceae bacterium]MDD4549532.1 s-methyl-5-thioribose-1-phosphate isomerase [Syntrophomonadaceae bacterium]
MREPLLININNTVFLRDDTLIILDRRRFPHEVVEVVCSDYEEVAKSIENMVVQGAGDIAITAGYGLYLAARQMDSMVGIDIEAARTNLLKAKKRLINTRPTGFHIAVLLNHIIKKVNWSQYNWSVQILECINLVIKKQDIRSELTGKWAETLVQDGDCILTHCFPGSALLHMLQLALKHGKKIELIATETRPYLQGARLTAWAVSELGVPVTLITDSMAAYCMSQGMISKVFTAADRIALDGTVANKVGTFQLALAARYHQLPFYILGYGGPDKYCESSKDIPVEQRDSEEVLVFNGVNISGKKVKGFYPAFDLTPPQLIGGIITDRGIISPWEVNTYWSLPVDIM